MNATDFTSEPIGYTPLAPSPARVVTIDEYNERIARIVRRAQYLALLEVERVIADFVNNRSMRSDIDLSDTDAMIREVAATLGVPVPKDAQS